MQKGSRPCTDIVGPSGNGMADAIGWLLDRPETAARMGQAGRRRVQEEFTWARCVDAYDALYRSVYAQLGEMKKAGRLRHEGRMWRLPN